MSVITTSAVIAECEHCKQRSQPMDPQKVEDWTARHEAAHAREALRERMAQCGHATDWIMEWMDPDDSSAHAFCSCGWKSKSAKHCWMDDYIIAHLQEVESTVEEAECSEL